MKKLLILVALLALPMAAHAQTPVSKETANTYFSNCVAQPSTQTGFSKQSQNMLCACTAARMTQYFSMEDMKAMTGTEPVAARGAYNKMLVNLYAPCMETPAYDYYYNTCAQNPDTAKFGDVKSICRCLGTSMALHLKSHGPEVFQKLLSQNPQMTDPMSALTSDPEFNTFAQEKLTSCLK